MRYSQIKQALREAEIIDEVSMSPSSLEAFANSPEAEGMLIGIEWEMCVPNTSSGDDDYDQEPDYDQNQSAGDIDEIINFFSNGEYSNMGRSTADRLRSEMWELYLDWSWEQINNNIDDDDLDSRVRDRLADEVSMSDMADLAQEQWQEENPDKDGTTDEASEEILELARTLRDRTVDDMMEEQGREWQYAYDNAREEIVDEMRDDSDYDQQAWLNDIGVDDMQDAERHWGLDWPYYTENYGGGDNDVDQVAEAFTEATGYQAQGYNNYHAASRTDQQAGGYFIIEPDGSIDADSGDAGLEFISPAMPLKDGLEMINKVKAWASEFGCYTNKSTGLHMNISVPNMTIESLDYVKLALFLGDEHVLKEFDRTYNSYAKSAMKVVKEKIQANPENATALLAKMKEHVNAAASKLVHTGVTQKYTSINTKDKYVEFRGPGGNYLEQDIPKLVNTALRAAQALRIATDDGAYKQEYAKKLYKLVSPNEGDWTDPNNSVALFSRYALGQINKSELVNNVRQAQVARKEKKGDEQQYWVMNKDGTGGKQMVFATSETEAIIKGGKQMGMKREDSINTLKAELMERPQDDNAPESLSQSWKDWVEDTLPNVTVDTANSVRQRIINGGDQLSGPASAWIIRQIDNELRSRQDQGVVDGNETRWKVTLDIWETTAYRNVQPVYVDADSPRQAKVKAKEIFQREAGLDVPLAHMEAIATTQDAGRTEQSWIVLDGFNRPVGTIQARSNDEALRIYSSVNNVDTRNYTAVSVTVLSTLTTSREEFDTLPEVWQAWLEGVGTYASETLQTTIDGIANGSNPNAVDLSVEQRDSIIGTINVELRRRRETDYTQLANTANNAENAVRASLPAAHRGWLENIADKSDMDLINVLRNVSTTTVLNDQQAAYFRVTIRHELRRRGINPDSETAQAVGNHLQSQQVEPEIDLSSPDDENIDDIMGDDDEQQMSEWDIRDSQGRVVANIEAGSAQSALDEYMNAYEVEDITGYTAVPTQQDAAIQQQAEVNESINLLRKLAGLK